MEWARTIAKNATRKKKRIVKDSQRMAEGEGGRGRPKQKQKNLDWHAEGTTEAATSDRAERWVSWWLIWQLQTQTLNSRRVFDFDFMESIRVAQLIGVVRGPEGGRQGRRAQTIVCST